MLAVGITVFLCAVFFSSYAVAFPHETRILKLSWSTDVGACISDEKTSDNCGQLGPDGPWQAPLLWMLGQSNQPHLAVYPHHDQWTSVLSSNDGGIYDAKPDEENISYTRRLTNESFTGGLYNDTALVGSTPKNITLNMASDWNITLPNGKSYTRKTGLLGLIQPGIGEGNLLSQLVASNETASAGWGLQMGSASLGLAGSLTLGGYDQGRLAGTVASFKLDDPLKPPDIKLTDILLGVEAGGSPFGWRSEVTNDTMWTAPNPTSGVPIQVSARDPGMYLPKGACNKISRNLPVHWRDDIGYYVWNTTDSNYGNVTTSPAWIGFTFLDRDNKSITIKVLFALLNLKLEQPIVKETTHYFPCHEVDTTTTPTYSLGRAFLQGAYLAYNYETNSTYLAQAVGPAVPSSTLYPFPGVDKRYEQDNYGNFLWADDSAFLGSWDSTWTPLPYPDGFAPVHKRRLSKRIIAGIAVGSVAVVTVVLGGFWLLWRRRRRLRAAASDDDGMSIRFTRRKRGELEGDYPALELEGKGTKQELEAPNVVHEVKGSDVVPVFELEGEMWKERPVMIDEDGSSSDESDSPPRYSWDQSDERISVGVTRRRGSTEKRADEVEVQEVSLLERKEDSKQEVDGDETREEQEVSPLESKDDSSRNEDVDDDKVKDEDEECSPMAKDEDEAKSYPVDANQ